MPGNPAIAEGQPQQRINHNVHSEEVYVIPHFSNIFVLCADNNKVSGNRRKKRAHKKGNSPTDGFAISQVHSRYGTDCQDYTEY